jgi:hypothetical protein
LHFFWLVCEKHCSKAGKLTASEPVADEPIDKAEASDDEEEGEIDDESEKELASLLAQAEGAKRQQAEIEMRLRKDKTVDMTGKDDPPVAAARPAKASASKRKPAGLN